MWSLISYYFYKWLRVLHLTHVWTHYLLMRVASVWMRQALRVIFSSLKYSTLSKFARVKILYATSPKLENKKKNMYIHVVKICDTNMYKTFYVSWKVINIFEIYRVQIYCCQIIKLTET